MEVEGQAMEPEMDQRLNRLTAEVAALRHAIEDLVALVKGDSLPRSWEGAMPEDRTVDGVLIGMYQATLPRD